MDHPQLQASEHFSYTPPETIDMFSMALQPDLDWFVRLMVFLAYRSKNWEFHVGKKLYALQKLWGFFVRIA
jgi:hypothetical protein